MFNRFINWLFPKKDSDGYTPTERHVFKFNNGFKTVVADPLVIWKKLMEKFPEISQAGKVAYSQSKDALTFHDKLIEQIRLLFDLKPYDDASLSELEKWPLTTDETLALLNDFLAYCEEAKKKLNLLPISFRIIKECSKSDGDLPTENGSDYGSIVNEPSIDKPTSSLSEPVLH